MPIIESVCRSILTVIIIVFIYARIINFKKKRKKESKNCPICGKKMSLNRNICRSCEYDPRN